MLDIPKLPNTNVFTPPEETNFAPDFAQTFPYTRKPRVNPDIVSLGVIKCMPCFDADVRKFIRNIDLSKFLSSPDVAERPDKLLDDTKEHIRMIDALHL